MGKILIIRSRLDVLLRCFRVKTLCDNFRNFCVRRDFYVAIRVRPLFHLPIFFLHSLSGILIYDMSGVLSREAGWSAFNVCVSLMFAVEPRRVVRLYVVENVFIYYFHHVIRYFPSRASGFDRVLTFESHYS